VAGWRESTSPIMCSYKLVEVRFDMIYMLQARIEEFVQKVCSPTVYRYRVELFKHNDECYKMLKLTRRLKRRFLFFGFLFVQNNFAWIRIWTFLVETGRLGPDPGLDK
jgi:Phosphatidylinositol transfer protein